jgi:hypothetical protein
MEKTKGESVTWKTLEKENKNRLRVKNILVTKRNGAEV